MRVILFRTCHVLKTFHAVVVAVVGQIPSPSSMGFTNAQGFSGSGTVMSTTWTSPFPSWDHACTLGVTIMSTSVAADGTSLNVTELVNSRRGSDKHR
jgi:hypothetical protein